MKKFHSCVTPDGKFIYGIHKPHYQVNNFRTEKEIKTLGSCEGQIPISNQANYPDGSVNVSQADWIFEIPNPFTFRGATFIDKEWADASRDNLEKIRIPSRKGFSLSSTLGQAGIDKKIFTKLPEELQLATATGSNDPEDLVQLAEISTEFEKDSSGNPTGLQYVKDNEKNIYRAKIYNHRLFEAVANNPYLPDNYKQIMVLRPGAQGRSEIVGEYHRENKTHIFEYLRRNSYIAGGHYAANMADDAIRYSIENLSFEDMEGLRHLYYQRTYTRLAKMAGVTFKEDQTSLTIEELEELRCRIRKTLVTGQPDCTATLWGWNFGFDYAPTRYRLHASHQQIHQQYAMLPDRVEAYSGNIDSPCGTMPSYGCGDLICKVIEEYDQIFQSDFFTDYRKAIFSNRRMDQDTQSPSSLIVWENEHVILFVPKAQTSQWELQIMTVPGKNGQLAGNILEAETEVRKSLNQALFFAQKALYGRGAEMVTSIEYPKRIHHKRQSQPLIYCLLPRLPESPGAFSEAQLRYINGHYPEDFAAVCRTSLQQQGFI